MAREETTRLGKLKARVKESMDSPEPPRTEAGESSTIATGNSQKAQEEKSPALKRARRRIARQEQEIARLRAALDERDGARVEGIRPENIVWIFGSGRTGSTWIAAMMDEMKNQAVWFEPRVGQVFDPFRFQNYKGTNFVLSAHYENIWLQSIRTFALDGANARFAEAMRPDSYLMVKDPAGSVGAPLVMKAMPESRMVLLIRDPRDVVASWLDAARKGGWQNERRRKVRRQDETQADTSPKAFVKRHADAYVRVVGNAKAAFEAHKGRKVLIKYEDLRADTLGTMRRLYSTLEIPVDEGELARSVEKHSWENIPEEKKGEGKFYRKATPGGWQEDLTPRQAEIVERITAPLLEEFYPDTRVDS